MRGWQASAVLGAVAAALGCSASNGDAIGPGGPMGPGTGSGSSSVVGGSGGSQVIINTGTDTSTTVQPCNNLLAITLRDFSEAHPDFEQDPQTMAADVRRGMVEVPLGTDRKPIFRDGFGCIYDPSSVLDCDTTKPAPEHPSITSQASFDQWYRDDPSVNQTFQRELPLVETPAGSGVYVFDTTAFFPLGPEEGWGVTPPGNTLGQNFLFTTEVHLLFTYQTGQVFTFRGDDDLWIFVNGWLAVDLGGTHYKREGTLDFDAQAERLGLQPGLEYPMDIFHAERHTAESNFRVETNINCFTSVEVR